MMIMKAMSMMMTTMNLTEQEHEAKDLLQPMMMMMMLMIDDYLDCT